MSGRQSCPCGKPAPSGHLCRVCLTRLGDILEQLPPLAVELGITATRRDRLGPPSEGHSQTLYGPLPFSEQAAAHVHVLRSAVVSWVRWTVDTLAVSDWPADRLAVMCGWLADHRSGINLHPAAVEMLDELGDVRWRAAQLIDAQPVRRTFTGPCPEVEEGGGHCGGQVWAWFHPDSEVHPPVAKCGLCDHMWPATEWARLGVRIQREQARIEAAQRLATAITGGRA